VRADSEPRAERRLYANDSERAFAELLEFYGVRYEYEPVEFVLEWRRDGRPRAAFRPDFYLPDHGCFVELTTLDQRLVTRKHAKLRRLRHLYPEVEVNLLHRRDYEALASKYNIRDQRRTAGDQPVPAA
jgi:hypothetical protein